MEIQRLQKFLSAAGVCSRRQAEALIGAGRVLVNGRAAALGQKVGPGDRVEVDGRAVYLPGEHTYIMLNKPPGYVTTLRDDQGRPTVAQLVRGVGRRLYPVGRLDMYSQGLLLLTDDGVAANRLTHPAGHVEKVYCLALRGRPPEEAAALLRQEIDIGDGDGRVRALSAQALDDGRVQVTLGEGKNRQLRRMCAAVGLQVLRLERVAQGELRLGDLPLGKWRYLTAGEVKYLQHLAQKG